MRYVAYNMVTDCWWTGRGWSKEKLHRQRYDDYGELAYYLQNYSVAEVKIMKARQR